MKVFKIVNARGIQKSCYGLKKVLREVEYKTSMKKQIGKTIFLDRAAAEAALEGGSKK